MNSLLLSNFKTRTKLGLYFVFFAVFVFVNTSAIAQKKEFVVVLDAGHGGRDPGKVGYNGMKEKTIALKLALKAGSLSHLNL